MRCGGGTSCRRCRCVPWGGWRTQAWRAAGVWYPFVSSEACTAPGDGDLGGARPVRLAASQRLCSTLQAMYCSTVTGRPLCPLASTQADWGRPFWEQDEPPAGGWDAMFTTGVRPALIGAAGLAGRPGTAVWKWQGKLVSCAGHARVCGSRWWGAGGMGKPRAQSLLAALYASPSGAPTPRAMRSVHHQTCCLAGVRAATRPPTHPPLPPCCSRAPRVAGHGRPKGRAHRQRLLRLPLPCPLALHRPPAVRPLQGRPVQVCVCVWVCVAVTHW